MTIRRGIGPGQSIQGKNSIFLVGIIIVVGSEFLIRDFLLPQNADAVTIDSALAAEWVVFAFMLLFWIPRFEKKTLTDTGFDKFRRRYLIWGIIFFLLAFVVSSFVSYLEGIAGLSSLQSLQPMLGRFPLPTLLSLFLTGTFLEETFYRGYLIERVALLTNRRWVGAVFSWVMFTLVHLKFFEVGPTIGVSVISGALVLLYMREKSVGPCMGLHGVNDGLAYLLFPLVA